MKVIYEDSEILVVVKPRFLPTANLAKKPDQETLVRQVLSIYPELASIKGVNKDEFSLLHRLDNDTEGLVLWAKNQTSYSFLLNEQKNNSITKNYLAYCQLAKSELSPKDYLLNEWQEELVEAKNLAINFSCKFVKVAARSSKVRAVSSSSSSSKATKVYNTDFIITKIKDNLYKVEASLTNGFRHQVRASLLALGLPIIGDKVYNHASSSNFAFWAYKITLTHPINKQKIEVIYKIDDFISLDD